jgi:vancomycin resistance protein YoaR
MNRYISSLQKKTDVEPVNALFSFENNKVSAFTLAKDGQAVDVEKLKEQVYQELKNSTRNGRGRISITVPIKVVKPAITNENVNNLGIQELIGEGTSRFAGSIENRLFNIQLAANRLNGILIAPDEVFSFNKALGDVSKLTGYKQAYVIENGRTVLGDGGGVCQVSTTLFRAALAAGLPIVERSPHAYRVSYYEQDSGPGIDAAVYIPSVDLKFKNDTGKHILIQTYYDSANKQLTFDLYGASDGREVSIGEPVILSQSPAPEPRYQDDPELPKDQVKQVDFAAPGANVYFTRTVKKGREVVINDKFTSNYRPWQAVFLKGTKE